MRRFNNCFGCHKEISGHMIIFCKDCAIKRRKEKNKQYMKQNYLRNKTKRKQAVKVWRARNKEKKRLQDIKYNQSHPASHAACQRTYTKQLRGGKCSICGSAKDLHFHHTDYKEDKGITVCIQCHTFIHNGGDSNKRLQSMDRAEF